MQWVYSSSGNCCSISIAFPASYGYRACVGIVLLALTTGCGRSGSGHSLSSGGRTGHDLGGETGAGGEATGGGVVSGGGGTAGVAGHLSDVTGGSAGAAPLGGVSGLGSGGASETAGRTGFGGTPASGGSGGTGGGLEASLAPLATAFCAAARSCCAKSGFPSSGLLNCESMYSSRLPSTPYLKKGTVTIDSVRLATCIAAYNQAATACTFVPLMTACSGVFVGTKGEGEACGVGGTPFTSGVSECKQNDDPRVCIWTGNSSDPKVTGMCHEPAHGQAGDACLGNCAKNSQDCSFDFLTVPGPVGALCFEVDGLYCDSTGKSPVCTAIVPDGGSCATDSTACASSSYCDFSGTTPTCRPAATLTLSCSSTGNQCQSQYVCGSDNRCEDPGFAFDATCAGTPPLPY